MDLAFIVPTAYLEQFAKQGDFYLALAHLIDDNGENEYARFHRREAEQGRRVILDNGLFEGAQVPPESLLRRARAIKAQVVCAPDVLYDSKGTIKAFKEFIRLKQDEGMVINVMGIPQANNPTQWWECWQFMEMHSDCNIIGLSILSVPKSFDILAGQQRDSGYITGARMYLLRQLSSLKSFSGRTLKPMHLLGLGESYADIVTASRLLPEEVVSNDSSSAFVHGIQGTRYTRLGNIPGGKDHTKLDFGMEVKHPVFVHHRDVQHNINTAKEIARREWPQNSS